MNRSSEIVDWLGSMGYHDEIPETLHNICNNSTTFVWDQLVQNTKSRQEIENMRNNVIINRLQKMPLKEQDEFPYPIKEISLYLKRQMLQNKLNNLRTSISEKSNKLNKLSRNNKISYLMIEKLESKIKQNKERDTLLDKKSELLKKHIQEWGERLIKNSNLSTLVELEEAPNFKQILGILQDNASTLKNLLQTVSLSDNQNQREHTFFSARKPDKNVNLLEKYITMTERKTHRKPSIIKQGRNKFGNSCKENDVKKCLFSDSMEVGCQEVKRGLNRESLGILPDSCFNNDISDGDINFLTNANDVFEERRDSLFFSVKKKNFVSNSCTNLNVSEEPKMSLKKLYANDAIKDTLRDLLHTHNRQIILNVFEKINDDLHLQITKLVHSEDNSTLTDKINKDDISKIQLYHVQTELEILKNNAVTKRLNNRVASKKEQIKTDLVNSGLLSNKVDNIMELLDLQLEEIGLDASLSVMKQEISCAQNCGQSDELQLTLKKLSNVKRNIERKINSITDCVKVSENTLKLITYTRFETINCGRKLGPFIQDLNWLKPLTEKLNLQEMRTFENFPLEYNRRCTFTDPSLYYRDICVDNFSTDIDLDSDTLFMLSETLSTPFNPPEVILLNIFRMKRKLDILSSFKNNERILESENCSLEELKQQESYVNFALDRLKFLNHSSVKTSSIADVIRQAISIWEEMPFKDFISSSRLVEGKDYKFYEKQYDDYYNNF